MACVKADESAAGNGSVRDCLLRDFACLFCLVFLRAVGMLLFWCSLSGYRLGDMPVVAADTLACFTQLPSSPLSAEAAAKCDNLLYASLKSMLLYPTAIFILGKQ